MAETTPILTSLGESLKQNVLVLAQPYARNFSIMNSTSNRPQEAASIHTCILLEYDPVSCILGSTNV